MSGAPNFHFYSLGMRFDSAEPCPILLTATIEDNSQVPDLQQCKYSGRTLCFLLAVVVVLVVVVGTGFRAGFAGCEVLSNHAKATRVNNGLESTATENLNYVDTTLVALPGIKFP